ncbi:hypothetical protein GCM10023201_56440 [Actinomycetospora corticicola]|uniref:4-amino-4-deoxy-L-arabinose transferase-like glycosyltransferase n=1 Tax=Actinomycetospora corticicola TaxID=663602 RepID=A0A7Y9J7R5_9PSEU|nr:hypothetical protein [Actinomycetospora corticicola]NYD38498.1 hypothetical protein [Actinomycetospora corticicola]
MAEAGILLTYLAASVWLFHRALGALGGRATGVVASDSSLFTWWLGWTWYAISHGLDPFVSTWQNAPAGVNGMWNTGVPVLGVLLAPVTATVGPVVADNVAMILGPVASAYLAHRCLAVLVRPRWIRALAGLVYGFSPFLIAHAWVGHVNLVWSVFPPIVLWASVRVLAAPRRPWLAGALLGVAFSLQMGLYTQTVALGALALVVVALVLALSAPRAALRRVPALLRSLTATAGVIAVLCAYPVWVLLAGPSRPRTSIREATETGADAANLLIPSPLTAIRPGTDALAAQLRVYPGEQGSYLGVAMLLVVLAAVVVVASRTVLVTFVVTIVLGVLSLGTSLAVLDRDTGVWLPWRLLVDLPLLGQAEPGRLAPFVALGVVTIWALALAHLTRPRPDGRWVRAGRFVAAGLVLAAAVTWVPGGDHQGTTDASAPAFFRAGTPGIPPGAIVELVPRPSQDWVRDGGVPVRWQAVAGFSYRQTGGYFIGGSDRFPVLHDGEIGAFQQGVLDGGRGDVAAARADLAAKQVDVIVIVPDQVPDPDGALAWSRAVAGSPGRLVEGSWVIPLR